MATKRNKGFWASLKKKATKYTNKLRKWLKSPSKRQIEASKKAEEKLKVKKQIKQLTRSFWTYYTAYSGNVIGDTNESTRVFGFSNEEDLDDLCKMVALHLKSVDYINISNAEEGFEITITGNWN